ncbi:MULTISPECIES: hypothetical protein [unclassified Chryseobacterium]|uniref:hypothetical protein n=1 Tax=unclassified Chryseobacterium TaxID=2593645 RepID=UPI00226AC04D|nr:MULTISPECIES: hypothetical protein [unclassified Chryseobacterium]
MSIPLNTIYSYFETGDFPTQEQFQASWSSFWHKDESIPTTKIAGLDNLLQNKADKAIFETHVSNPDSHANYLAKRDASNLNNENIQSWKTTLGVGDLPTNIATVDAYDEAGNISEFGNVYTKGQSNDMFMSYDDYTDDDGNILAEKIEALGITTLVESLETSISDFAANSAAYVFEDNDFIAIPVNNENYSLYMFKGGEKTDKNNYLPTGISNVTIGMVEGLQASLNGKMDKPSGNGSFFIRSLGSVPVYASISPASNYLLQWNGGDFRESNVYNNAGKLGIGTTAPSEQLHLTGKLRSKGVILDENNEIVTNQITYYNKGFYATDSGSVRKKILMKEDLASEFLQIPDQLSDADKALWKTKMNGGWTTGTMSVAVITPPIVDAKDKNYWINLKGANLNLPPTNFKVELCTQNSISAATATVIAEIPASQVQLYTNGIDLTFYYNFKDIPLGSYKIRLWNGVAYYLTNFLINVVDNIQRVDLNSIVWSKKIYNDASSPGITESGSSVTYSSDFIVKQGSDDSSFIAARKTNELVGADEDFYMTVEITGQTAIINSANGSMTHFVGLVNTENQVDLLNQTIVNVRLVQSYWYPMAKIYPDTSSSMIGTTDTTFSVTAIFIRRGGNWTTIISSNNQVFISTKIGYTGAVAFGMYNQNTAGRTGASANIVELYKI